MFKSTILKKFIKNKRITLLNIGPMSKNLVDVSIEISDKFNLPLTLIASRRQIEGKKWMKKKYGFNSKWSMHIYAKLFYEKFFEHNPELVKYKL